MKEDDFEIVPPPIYLDEKNFRVLDSAISADVRCGAKALEDNERDLHLNGYGTPDLLKKQQGVNSKKSSSGKKIKKRKLAVAMMMNSMFHLQKWKRKLNLKLSIF